MRNHEFLKVRQAVLAIMVASIAVGCVKTNDGDNGGVVDPPVAANGLPRGLCTFSNFSPAMAGIQLLNSLGDPQHDQVMSQEIAIQRQWYGVPTTYYIINEGSPNMANAFASPAGYILFGYYMYYRTISQYGGLAVAGVLAHEGGHRIQQVAGWTPQMSTPVTELEADAISGFYMAIVKRWAWSQIQGYFANTYASGNYDFNNPGFHGTPNQRVTAAYLGVNLGMYSLQIGRLPSWAELHTAIMQQMPMILASPNRVDDAATSAQADNDEWSAAARRVSLSDVRARDLVPPSLITLPAVGPMRLN